MGAIAIRGAVGAAGIEESLVEECLMGCVLSAGPGRAPARQAVLAAGLPQDVGCSTVNKMCGSGMKAVMLAGDRLLAGGSGAIVAGGMESMTNAPFMIRRISGRGKPEMEKSHWITCFSTA